MQQTYLARGFLFLCLAASLTTVFFVLQSFIAPLIIAAMAAFLFYPAYRACLRFVRGYASVAAGLTTLLALLLFVLPVALFGTAIFREASALQQSFTENPALVTDTVARVQSTVGKLAPGYVDLHLFETDLRDYSAQVTGIIAQNLGAFFSSAARLLLSAFVFLVAFFFLLKDGPRLKNFIIALSPLEDHDDAMILRRIEGAVNATVKGSLTIALIQGFLTCVGFVLFGVPNAALWGSVAAVMALVPGVGTSLVLAPAIIYLFSTGDTFSAVGLLIWGATAVGLVDNALGPTLIGSGMRLHPLLVFLSVLGGFSFFGPLGFILGPLSVSMCLTFIDIYFALIEKEWKRA